MIEKPNQMSQSVDFTGNFSEAALKTEIAQKGIRLSFEAGDVIVQPEKYVKVVPLLTKGTVKVLRVDEFGHELFLYYILAGESCAVSMASSLTDKPSNIKAIAEESTELIAVPSALAMEWYRKYPSWQLFVLETMNLRFDELIRTIDSVAFDNVDKRLVNFLKIKEKALKTKTIVITHQEIANELSTSREIISRLLKKLENDRKIVLSRNKIEIISLV
jgi:CRP/FNR family transcriptional regulator, anaerobic regulatory protein